MQNLLTKLKKETLTVLYISVAVLGLIYVLNASDTVLWLEVYGTTFGLIQAGLILAKKKENWVFYNAYILAFLIFSIHLKLYGDVVENSIYLIMGAIGFITWYKPKTETKIQYCKPTEIIKILSFATGITMLGVFLLRLTDDPLPFLDALTTGLGIAATYLMAKKKVEAWILWFVCDILMSITYFLHPEQPVYILTLNIIWTFMAIGSWYTWHKESKKELLNE